MTGTVAVNGVAVGYADQGSGPAVVMIHGWLMTGGVWQQQLPLAERMRLITVDIYGQGEGAGEFSYQAGVDRILAVLDKLGIDRAVVVGWSLGGQLALLLQQQAPERCRGLVLVATTPCFCSRDGYAHGLPLAEVRQMQLRLRRDYQRTAAEFCRLMFTPDELALAGAAAAIDAVLAALPAPEAAAASLRELMTADLRDGLGRVGLPLLLVHGAADRICPASVAGYLQDLLPPTELVLLPAVGHAPFITRPAEFNRIVADFVARLHDPD